jgi:ATP/maltotriose-dependent transcriptional regulator MalT
MRNEIVAYYRLSEREIELLELLGKGYTHEGAAKEMGVAKGTLEAILRGLCKRVSADREMLQKLGMWMILKERPEFTEDEKKPQVWQCPPAPEGCGRMKAIGEYPFWPIDMRCNDCVAIRVEDRKSQVRREQATTIVSQISKKLRGKSANFVHALRGMEELFQLTGGYEAFIKRYMDDLNDAREKNPGSKQVLDAMRDLWRIWLELSKQQDAHEMIEQWDDKQTRDYLVQLMYEELGKDEQKKLLSVYLERDSGQESGADASAG